MSDVIDLLYRLADDELLIGHRNSEWTGVAPIIEEDIAFSSMAQDEMGHALAYYTVLHEVLEQESPDKLAFLRDAKEFRNAILTALPRQDWAHAIMRQFLYDAAEQVRLEKYVHHPFEPLAQLARKFHGEEKYHFLHARTWIQKLGTASEESNERMQVALDSLWPYALGLFEAGRPEQPLPFDEASLCHQWLQLVCSILTGAQLTVSAVQSTEGTWSTEVTFIGGRYDLPTADRIELLNAMQKVYRIDPEAAW